ncbi:hypothetical protein PMZ80_001560 [Knufia obscura]|uniref:Carboxylic ester hydrolase n=2 Tax=Knufia TaxID=430999 RepID=A0AAN8FCA0_9EURO|nr:hypothetical protein PMZ80_001560 [Knufia obscura]KAK5955616.1 hypothetical protein OHC33_003257 [Knufia fluminis]
MSLVKHLLLLSLAAHLGYAGVLPRSGGLNAQNVPCSLTLLYQNNLNASDDSNHVGFLVTDPTSQDEASQACASLGQALLTGASAQNHSSDLSLSLNYEDFAGRIDANQQFWIDGAILTLSNESIALERSTSDGAQLSALCSNSANASEPQNSTATPSTRLSVQAGTNTYQGYFNKKSFRFLGIRYAEEPPRFEHSQLYEPQGQIINATGYGEQCLQSGGGSEDCLFLNIQTPYIPKAGSESGLRPVMFWIHGGGFTGGTGADPLSDGSNLASREDIVVVTINYRLSTLGFLAIPGTSVTGNYGIGDQVTALEWTIQNIAYFGGDPNRITIIGESAGAGSVRTLLGSPRAVGKYQGAVAMSNLGGGQDLGRESNYGTTYSLYYTIAQSYNVSGSQLVNATNCTSSTSEDSVACLRAANATILNTYSSAPRYVVEDNIFVNTTELNLQTPDNGTAYVPTMFGIVDNDGASFSNLPINVTAGNLTGALQVGLDIDASAAASIISSGLFPYVNVTGNWTIDAFNVTQRIATDDTFRCIDQATIFAGAANKVFPSAYYYQFDRAISGYNPNNLPGAPVTPGYPNGNPNEPYFKLHGADMPWVFGNFYDEFRDDNDLYSVQLVSGLFAEFIRSGQPNPSQAYLEARGYTKTLQAIQEVGQWQPVTNAESQGNVRHLDYPGSVSSFVDAEQCAWLGYPVDYYVQQ